MATEHPKSAGRLAADFREQLVIDRYDPVLTAMRPDRRTRRHHTTPEDAVTWNVFRSLRQIDPRTWLPELLSTAFPDQRITHTEHATVELWQPVAPPPALLVEGDEGDSEIDVVIETPTMVWFLDAPVGSDSGSRSHHRAGRDQLLHAIDAGSYYAGTRRFFCSLLIADDRRPAASIEAVHEYRDLAAVQRTLKGHRPDGLVNLGGVSLLPWRQLAEVLADCAEGAPREEERAHAARALAWLEARQPAAV